MSVWLIYDSHPNTHRPHPISFTVAPETDKAEKDPESGGTCNGSASRNACKHQSKRERLEREKEWLRLHEEEEEEKKEEDGEENANGRQEGEEALRQVQKTR